MSRVPSLGAVIREWAARAGSVLRVRRSDADLLEELQTHIDMADAEAARTSDSPAHAKRAARIRTGTVAQGLDAMRDQRGLPWLDDVFTDLRIGWRMLAKSPGFVIVAVLTLALGIGANSAMFTVADRLLFQPSPFAHAERLDRIYDVNPKLKLTVNDTTSPSPANFVDWRSQTRSFDDTAAWRTGGSRWQSPEPVGSFLNRCAASMSRLRSSTCSACARR